MIVVNGWSLNRSPTAVVRYKYTRKWPQGQRRRASAPARPFGGTGRTEGRQRTRSPLDTRNPKLVTRNPQLRTRQSVASYPKDEPPPDSDTRQLVVLIRQMNHRPKPELRTRQSVASYQEDEPPPETGTPHSAIGNRQSAIANRQSPIGRTAARVRDIGRPSPSPTKTKREASRLPQFSRLPASP